MLRQTHSVDFYFSVVAHCERTDRMDVFVVAAVVFDSKCLLFTFFRFALSYDLILCVSACVCVRASIH